MSIFDKPHMVEVTAALIAAVVALVSAFVGGSLAYMGVESTIEAQKEAAAEERHRQAYVKLLSEAEQYRIKLISIENAARANDTAEIEKANSEAWAQSANVYSAKVEAELVFSAEEMEKVDELMVVFFREELDTAIPHSAEVMKELSNQGRERFGKDALSPTGHPSPAAPSVTKTFGHAANVVPAGALGEVTLHRE
ncbi:hypothetical protein ACH9DO_10490 [Kocuria sp. M1N1S27]|uniref:hypothetical protein n=1 Tax=Kocuria kalidii TaxID=3376283 RepID=UPI0037B6BACA